MHYCRGMNEETKSIDKAIKKQQRFVPPFCSNPCCKNHKNPRDRFFIKYGFNKILKFPYRQQKFQCKDCKTVFSYSYFFLHYREQLPDFNENIFNDFVNGMSDSAIARRLNRSSGMVRYRLEKRFLN